jgi:uncharacterized membrane protein YqjE
MATGPLNALRRIGARSVTLLLSRAEFAALELAQARGQLVRWLTLALAAAVVLQLALLAAAAALVALLWDRFGLFTLLALFLLFGGAGTVLVMWLRREIAAAPPLLSETLTELAKDRDALFGREDADPAQAGPESK